MNRGDLAERFTGVGVELGVAAGEFSEEILRRSACRVLWSIDRWDDHHGLAEYRQAAALLAATGAGRCIPLRMSFHEALPLFPDAMFDFIYIDGYAHGGQEGGQTLSGWWTKLKPGGIFAGHDYTPQYWATVAAVNAFAAQRGLTVEVTTAADELPSWWTTKPR